MSPRCAEGEGGVNTGAIKKVNNFFQSKEETTRSSYTDLDLIFRNAAGKKVILNIEEPKAGITKAEIDAAMEVVVNNNIFNTSGGDIVEAVEGRLRTITLDPVVA